MLNWYRQLWEPRRGIVLLYVGIGRGARSRGGGTCPSTAVDVELVLPHGARRSAAAFPRASREEKLV